ncbi:hypothetical protein LXA43DRAFT_1140606 [Ganoderma leucocontextum]|nr:hypothetical protein LXA43DRAFT_1140606 [Ganoderma leucocontextum]
MSCRKLLQQRMPEGSVAEAPGLDRLQTSIRPQQLGYDRDTTISPGSALKRWSRIHTYTFAAMANVVVHHAGGGGPRRRTLLVGLRPRTSPKDEFALEFGAEMLEFGTRDELAWARETQPQPRDAPPACYVGVLPVTFCLLGTGVVAHLLEAHVGSDERSTDALAQFVPLCVDAMNLGFVFVPQVSEDGARRDVLPKVIKAVRRAGGRKGWRCQTVDENEVWPALSRAFARNWKSDLSPLEIFSVYDKLWPFQKEQKDRVSVPVLEEVD